MPDVFDQVADQQTNPQPVQQPQGDIFDQLSAGTYKDPLTSSPESEGEQTNDVGNTIVVPKNYGTGAEESFADTMARAAEHGKTVTQDQINAEMRTAPKKAAQVLLAAPAIGAAGTAALAGAGEAGASAPKMLQMSEKALENFAEHYPMWSKIAALLAKSATYGAGGVTAYEVYKKLFD